MVLGNSSKFTEGFTSFTADDDLMIANLKQALNYSKENVAIPNPSINISSSNSSYNSGSNSGSIPTSTFNMVNSNKVNTKSNLSLSNSNMLQRNNTLPTAISAMESNIPTTTPSFTMLTQSSPTNSNMETKMDMESDMVQNTTTPQITMSINTKPEATQIYNTSSSNNVEKFNTIKRVLNNGDENNDEDSDNEEDATLEEEDKTNEFENTIKKKSTTRRQSDRIEGFRGSLEIESKEMRNILLALLLSCIGYLVVYSMGKNLLPLDDISPQLRKFKGLIYTGLFFLITYICLEVF